jgi:hypothetical protein
MVPSTEELRVYKRFLQPIYRMASSHPPPKQVRLKILRLFFERWKNKCSAPINNNKGQTLTNNKRSVLWIEKPSFNASSGRTRIDISGHTFYVQYV